MKLTHHDFILPSFWPNQLENPSFSYLPKLASCQTGVLARWLIAWGNFAEFILFALNAPNLHSISISDRPRFFDQVEHQITNASIENRHFFTK